MSSASTWTPNLQIEKPATGAQAGVWGNTADTNYDIIDQATDGNVSIALSSSTYQLNTQPTPAGNPPPQGVNKVCIFTGALTSQGAVNISPNTAQKLYVMQNKTTGSFPIVFQQGTGAAVTLQPGYTAILYCDGLGSGAGVNLALDNPQFTNLLVTGSAQVNGSLTFGSAQTFAESVTFDGAVSMAGGAVITGLTVATTPAAPNDLYYRSAAGTLAALAVGSTGQVLTVSSSGALQWSTIGLSVGAGIGGSVANAIYFSNASNVLAQDASVTLNSGYGIGIGVLSTHSLHIGINRTPEIWLDIAPSNLTTENRQIIWATGGTPRWQLLAQAAAEAGSNQGSNLALFGYNDAGSSAGAVMYFARNSGNVTVGNGDQGAQLAVLNASAGQPAMIVRGAASQTAMLQSWQNSSGGVVASIDNLGNLTCANMLSLTSYGRLDIHGTVSGHPLGTIHLGRDSAPNSLSPCLVLENANNYNDAVPAGAIRLFYRNGYLQVQFNVSGVQYWATMALSPGSGQPLSWQVTMGAPAA